MPPTTAPTTPGPRPVDAYPETLYRAAREAELLPDIASVDDAAVERYRQNGFIAVERAFDEAAIDDARAAVVDLVAGRNERFNEVQYEASAEGTPPADLDSEARVDRVRKLMRFTQYDARLERVMADAALRAVLEKLIGATSACFQEMALLKPPGGGVEKPWHQDHAYFDYPMGTPIVGVWVALDRAGTDNGCMNAVEGSHHEPVPHHRIRDWQICDTHLDGKEIVAVPLPPGGAMLFSGLLMHGTPTNHSPSRRRALQFHYAPVGVTKTGKDERLAVFGAEGLGVEC